MRDDLVSVIDAARQSTLAPSLYSLTYTGCEQAASLLIKYYMKRIVEIIQGNYICMCMFLDTSVSEIEETFKTFTNRNDIAIILINQVVSIERRAEAPEAI